MTTCSLVWPRERDGRRINMDACSSRDIQPCMMPAFSCNRSRHAVMQSCSWLARCVHEQCTWLTPTYVRACATSSRWSRSRYAWPTKPRTSRTSGLQDVHNINLQTPVSFSKLSSLINQRLTAGLCFHGRFLEFCQVGPRSEIIGARSAGPH